jgi:hypothetical protein
LTMAIVMVLLLVGAKCPTLPHLIKETLMKKQKATPAVVVIPKARLVATIKAINESFTYQSTAIQALAKLDNDYSTMQAKAIAEQLVANGCQWALNTIMQELSRIRRLKTAGQWKDGMNCAQVREAVEALPKKERKAKAEPVANGTVSKESAEQLVGKISRHAPDTIAISLVDAIVASGIESLDDALAEARRLIIQVINDKKKAKK